MKMLLIGLVLAVALGGVMAGCTSTETCREHHQRLCLQERLQARNMVEDWDYFWLAERHSRLNMWHAYVGF